jgi:transcriptional regulator with XRE-family HTH domain
MQTTTRIDGLSLKLLRVSHDVPVRAVAQAAGCSRVYINRIEAARSPSERAVAKYLAALREAEAR